MPTNDKLIAHGRIDLARKIIKQQSTTNIILDNSQTEGRGHKTIRYESGERTERGERGRTRSGNNNKLTTPTTTHINASATGEWEREDGDMERTASIFTAEYWVRWGGENADSNEWEINCMNVWCLWRPVTADVYSISISIGNERWWSRPPSGYHWDIREDRE